MVAYSNLRSMCTLFYLCMLASALHTASLFAPAVGSNTSVSQQALTMFPSTDLTNQMLGFAAFANGFTLTGAGSCIYNSFYPIAGTVTLNGGTLSLDKDLLFQKGLSFYNGGVIAGNSHTITFQDTDSVQLPISPSNLGSLAYVTQINTSKSVISCDWSFDNSYLAAVNNASSILGLYGFNGKSITPVGTQSATTNFLCVRWHPTLNYLVTGRAQNNSINNIQLWQYVSASNSFIQIDQQQQNKDIVAISWHTSGNYIAFGTGPGSNGIVVYAFSPAGLTYITAANISSNRSISPNSLSWDATGTYIVAGTTNSNAAQAYELSLYSFNGSTLDLNAFVDLNIVVNAASYCPTGNYVAVGLASGSDTLQMYAHNPAAGTLTKLTSASVAEALSVTSVAWSTDGKYLVMGRVAGIGTEFRVYYFNTTSNTLTLLYGFDSAGTLNDVRWSRDGNYFAVGDSINYLSIYGFATNLVFNATKLVFNSDVTFNVPTTFQGNSAIDGNSNTVQFGSQGSLIVGSGATLALKNLTLSNIMASNFYCADGTAIITFNNVELALGTNDYNFNAGSFSVSGLLRIVGPYGFNYQSNQASTIASNSTLFVDYGSKFNYNPSISSNSLLTFTDTTASLVVSSATLQVSNSGLQLTKGYIELDGKCYIINNGTQSSQGLALGDGVSSANNVVMRILPEAQCIVTSGFIVDKSV